MSTKFATLAWLSAILCASSCSAADLYSRFQNPPREHSPVPFWFLNSELKASETRWQIDQMLDQHVYGALMHGRTGLRTPYLSDQWWREISSAVEYAHEKGFQTWIYDEYNWPSGKAGGAVVRDHPEFRPRGLVITSEEVKGPARYEAAVDTEGLVAVLASRKTGEGLSPEPAVQLTSFLDDGDLSWDVPEGKWLVMTAVEKVIGRYVDVLNPDALKRFISLTHDQYFERLGKYFPDTIPGTFTDEPTMKWMPVWTDGFLRRFREIKGYDFTPYLGVLYHDMGSATVKLRCDYFDVVTTLYERAYWGTLSKWAQRHRIASTGHLDREEDIVMHARLAGDAMRCLRHEQIPGVDSVWGPKLLEVESMKLASSVAHLHGRERVLSETYAGCGHAMTIEEMKWMADWQYAGGVNMLVPHGFHYSIEGPEDVRRNDWPPSMFYQQPYWPHYHLFADYISRLSSVLSGGTHVADIAVYYPIKTIWANFSATSEEHGPCPGAYRDVVRLLFERNLDYDLLDDDLLAEARVEQGTLRVGSLAFKAVVLPAARVLPQESVVKLAEFLSNGGTVICVGRVPSVSIEQGEDDPKLAQIATDAILVGTAEGAEKVLRKVIEPDFRLVEGEKLYYNHVRHPDCEVYFISSQSNRPQSAVVAFRAAGYPELWDPSSGDRFALSSEREGESMRIRLDFAPHESRLVVFRDAQVDAPIFGTTHVVRSIDLPTKWGFEAKPYRYRGQTFPEDYVEASGYPSEMEIGDWCEQGMAPFSGTGVYEADFVLEYVAEDERLMLDLGDVRVVASVYVNGQLVGSRAWRPFVFDLTSFAREGPNTLAVEVTNTIGNYITTFKGGKWDDIPAKRLVSGLLGPVRLELIKGGRSSR